MDELYKWDRDDQLFAIRAFKNSNRSDKGQYLLQLIVDEDPVVRGKAALAMRDCKDSTLMEAVDGLLELDQNETTILACELLGFTDEVNFSDKLGPILQSSDDRVVRSAIETLDKLPDEETIELLHVVTKKYDDSWSKSIKRVLPRINSPELLDVIQRLYDRVDKAFQVELLQIGATLDSREAIVWVNRGLDETEMSKPKKTVIRWLLP